MRELDKQGALKDIKIVEFGQYIPGPLLGMLLSDQGASVIKVERPGGDQEELLTRLLHGTEVSNP